ncbi:MAG: peptidoglycan DD-metalloendopeptidase family protein [Bdellovibrionales bacterium]|nr:peptidoglycan DD-metalloendopeptidase family protein [Bdellovibrionales bacterium]
MTSKAVFPVSGFPKDAVVLDMSRGPLKSIPTYAIGKYLEKRPGVYETALFQSQEGNRNIHMGIDLFAPAGTEVLAFAPGKIFLQDYNSASGDYGYTLITQHLWDGQTLYVLWGHLAKASIQVRKVGQSFQAGEVLGWIGRPDENGGWDFPHLHFQVSTQAPERCDMLGAVSDDQLEKAKQIYLDPRKLLGAVY